MTNEEIRIKVAEAMGARLWNNPTQSGPSQLWGFQVPSPSEVFARMWLCGEADCLLPDYPKDLNACAEFEKMLTDEEHFSFRKHLWDIVIKLGPEDTWDRQFVSADAKTRCIAYLRTKGIIP
jgi:hypothetical protein